MSLKYCRLYSIHVCIINKAQYFIIHLTFQSGQAMIFTMIYILQFKFLFGQVFTMQTANLQTVFLLFFAAL